MNFRSSRFALLLGAINGFLFAVAYQPVCVAYDVYEYRRALVDFDGMPPQMFKVITPLGEYIFLILLFTIASYTVHRFFSTKIKSEIVLWQVVAIVVIAVPSLVLYVIEQINTFIGGFQVWFESSKWGNLPILPDRNDIEFGMLFLCLAVTVNFFYGAIIAKLGRRFVKN